MLVLSHQRSGSTEICRIVEQCLDAGTTISLSEFFNFADRTAFGDLLDAVQHFRSNNNPVTIGVLVVSNYSKNKKPMHGSDYLVPVNLTFKTVAEVYAWLYIERIKRLSLLDKLPCPYILKHFISLGDNKADNELEIKFARELVEYHISRGKFVFSYRKSLLESVFSGLIKFFYFDAKRAKSEDKSLLAVISDGHNITDMPVLEPEPITLRYSYDKNPEIVHYVAESMTDTILLLFEFYHLYLRDLHPENVVVYEDVIDSRHITLSIHGKLKTYDIDSFKPRFIFLENSDGKVEKFVEKKMNYGNYSRADYFVNSHVVPDIINHSICAIEGRSPGFQSTLKELGIEC